MKNGWTRRFVMVGAVFGVVIGSLAVSGCASLGVAAMPAEFGQAAAMLTEMIQDQGVMQEFAGKLEGDLFDPGIAAFTETRFGVRFVGTQGEVDLSASGEGTILPAGTRATLIEQLDGPLSDDQRNAILTILGWNRTKE